MKATLALVSAQVVEAAPTLNPSTNHRALAAAWVADLEAQAAAGMLAERTARGYRESVAGWLDWMDAQAVAVPTPAHVMAYVAHLRAALAPATVNFRLAAVRGLYAWTETRNAYPAIGRSVRGLAVRKDEPLDCLDRAQVAALLPMVDGDAEAALRDRALVQVLFGTALRLVSITAANVGDLDLLDAVLVYQGKGDRSKARRAYLSPSALDALRRYLATRKDAAGGELSPEAPLFSAVGNRAGGGRLTARSVRRVVVGLMERGGHVRRTEAGKIARPRVMSAHSLRRSGITAAYESGGLEAAQAFAGHADPKTTLRAYARVQKGKTLRRMAVALDLSLVVNA